MKRLLKSFAVLLTLLLLYPVAAHAMSVSTPTGTFLNGWFVDNFNIQVQYGDGRCGGDGTVSSFSYKGGAQQDGNHQYEFFADDLDNPFVSVDGSIPQILNTNPCLPSGANLKSVQQFSSIPLDALSPTVSITSPSGNITTSASNYSLSGTVNDSASGVRSVEFIINGQPAGLATVSGNTYTGVIQLTSGSNIVQVLAKDNVNHTDNSNQIVITQSNLSSGNSGTSAPASTSNPPTVSTTNNSKSDSTTAIVQQQKDAAIQGQLKFATSHSLKLNNDYLDPVSKPDTILQDNGFVKPSRRIYLVLLGIILVLLLLVSYNLLKNRAVFTRLDHSNSGLRRRIILIIVLPSLLPLVGLGFLSYQQLTANLKASLSQQLAKASQTSAIKLEREFAIRRKIISTNASAILQIKSQFSDQNSLLDQQKTACLLLVQTAPAKNRAGLINNSDSCLPFQAATAQIISSPNDTVSYTRAIQDGYTHAQNDLHTDEQQRIDTRLGEMRGYFPDLNELAIIDNGSQAHVQAVLPSSSNKHPVTDTYKSLLKNTSSDSIMLYDQRLAPHQLVITYPLLDSHKKLAGRAIAAYDTDYPTFIPAIWRATPKPYPQDAVYIVNAQQQLIYPHDPTLSVKDIGKLTAAHTADLVSIGSTNKENDTRVHAVAGTNLIVAVGAPPKNVSAPLAGIQLLVILAVIIFLLISLLLAIFFVGSIAREIDTLLRGAWEFAKGKLDYRIHLNSRDELSVLGNTMNQMANDIELAQTALIEKDKEFINIATHELKAPMTSIIGNLSMVTQDSVGSIDDTARKLIDQAYEGTIRLRDIVTDMLDIARLESGHVDFKPEILDIMPIAQSVIDMQSIPAQQASISLLYESDHNLPNVLADKNKLQIILTNFVSNAIKYNRAGGSVSVRHHVQDGMMVTAITDTGLGIPENQKGHIFEKFYRVQDVDRTNVPGTGLGMHITKRFIETMGGKVWFDSQHGTGTTFSFTLPITGSINPPSTSPAPTALK